MLNNRGSSYSTRRRRCGGGARGGRDVQTDWGLGDWVDLFVDSYTLDWGLRLWSWAVVVRNGSTGETQSGWLATVDGSERPALPCPPARPPACLSIDPFVYLFFVLPMAGWLARRPSVRPSVRSVCSVDAPCLPRPG